MKSLSTRRYRKLPVIFFLFFTQVSIISCESLNSDNTLKSCQFDQIYQFGDSLSDVGNFIRELPIGPTTHFTDLPFGQTFFSNATGRVTDGLLLIDYIGMQLCLLFYLPLSAIFSIQ